MNNVSTRTIIAVSNCKFSLEIIYKSVIEFDTLLRLRSPWGTKGREKVSTKKTKSMRCSSINAVIIDVQILPSKIINVKVYSNGKFHITGVRDVHQAEIGIFEIFKNIPKCAYELVPSDSNKIEIFFKTVMKNINFDIGFCVRREKVDEFFHNNTDFITSFESSINSGVTLKYPLKDDNEEMTDVLILDPNLKFFMEYQIPTEKKKKDLIFGKMEKYHSFRVFRSGKVIMSSRGCEFERVFNLFMKIINENKFFLREI
jgi:hypothetical protein